MSREKKNGVAAVTSAVHLIFVLSIVCFGTVYLTLGILLLPALTSAFLVGKDVIARRFDVYDSLSRRFFRQLKENLGMMKYFPLQLIAALQIAGGFAAGRVGMDMLIYPMIAAESFIMTLIVYIVSYHVFCTEKPSVTAVIIAMFYKVRYVIMIWVIMIILTALAGTTEAVILFFCGTILILAVQIPAFLGLASYKSARGEVTEEDIELFGEEFFNNINKK